MSRTVLIGLHDNLALRLFAGAAKDEGWTVRTTGQREEMLTLARTEPFDYYIMDANLGQKNSPDITPAIDVYNIVQERVIRGDAKFLALSANSAAIQACKDYQIPAVSKFGIKLVEDYFK
jgi:ActR/RegA family two-component response regulator